ncbi:hypothetical protein E0V51_23010 [Salmonella enterica subsp. enterica serovar Hvittingfoss]|nr:hypothetical protein [Salmonella enterica subsp. enterica serovar Hvittingfoss]
MSNVIDFKKAKDSVKSKKGQQKIQESERFNSYFAIVKPLKETFSFLLKSAIYAILFVLKLLSGTLFKVLATLTLFLFIVEWLVGRLNYQCLYKSVFFLAITVIVYVASNMCIKLLKRC